MSVKILDMSVKTRTAHTATPADASQGSGASGGSARCFSLGQFGLGFWQAWWIYALCAGDLFGAIAGDTGPWSMLFAAVGTAGAGSLQVGPFAPSTLLLLLSTIAYGVVALLGARSPSLTRLLERPRVLALPCSVACCVGTLGMAGGANILSAVSPGGTAVLLVCSMGLFSLANALLLVMWGQRWSTLASGRVGRYLYMSYAIAIALFFCLAGLPQLVRIVCASLLPAASVLILCRTHDETRQTATTMVFAQGRPLLLRPLAAAFALNVVWGAGLPCLALFAGAAAGFTAAGLAVAEVLLLCLVGYLAYQKPEVEAFALFAPVGVALASGLVLSLLVPGDLVFAAYGIATLGGACLDMLVMLVSCDMAFRLQRPVALVLGGALFVSRVGSLLGRFVFDWFVAGGAFAVTSVVLLCVLAVIVCESLIFSRAHLEALYRTRPILPREETVDDRCAAIARSFALTPREHQILGLLARGRSAPFIAQELGISPGTVKNHVSNIYRKVDVGDRQSLLNALDHVRGYGGPAQSS